jgi:hypothetical protein
LPIPDDDDILGFQSLLLNFFCAEGNLFGRHTSPYLSTRLLSCDGNAYLGGTAAIILPSDSICNITDRLNLSDSSCAIRYVTLCFLKHHLNFCNVVGPKWPSFRLVPHAANISLISSKTSSHSSFICDTASSASVVCTESDACSVWPICFSISENKLMLFEML